VLVELNMVEQRYRAAFEVLGDGATVTDLAQRYGVARQMVHERLWQPGDPSLRAIFARVRDGFQPAFPGIVPGPPGAALWDMATPGFPTSGPLDAPGMRRARFEVMEGERERLAATSADSSRRCPALGSRWATSVIKWYRLGR
jgi:hypothetical protein